MACLRRARKEIRGLLGKEGEGVFVLKETDWQQGAKTDFIGAHAFTAAAACWCGVCSGVSSGARITEAPGPCLMEDPPDSHLAAPNSRLPAPKWAEGTANPTITTHLFCFLLPGLCLRGTG